MSAPRTGVAANPFTAESPDREVPCTDCGRPVTLSGFAWEFAKAASEMLISKGEQPLRNDEMTRCDECGDAWRAHRLELEQTLTDEMNRAQRLANTTGLVDLELCGYLRKHGLKHQAEGIESGAAKYRATQSAAKTRGAKETK